MHHTQRHLLFSVSIRDCVVDYFRAGGKGGQKQNKTSSGVRVRHMPSGAKAEARDSRSQHQNKRAAFLRMAQSKEFQQWHRDETARRLNTHAAIAVGTHGSGAVTFGSRYVRTYDFVDRQVKDSTTGHTRTDIDRVMDGHIDSFIDARLKAAA